jgi:hypothetical protein
MPSLTVRILPFDRAAIPEAVARITPPAVLTRWRDIDRSAARPQLFVASDPAGECVGASLVTSRPHTAYRKIVDAVGSPEAVEALAEAVVQEAIEDGAVQVKWEGPVAVAGFTPLTPPVPSGPGTDSPTTASIRWLVPEPTLSVRPYYGQTTHFSCGAVTALAALQEDLDPGREMAFWQEATNHPACEPVRLGIAMARRRPELGVTIALDADEPVLLEHLAGAEQDWRAGLQRESRREAAALGIPIQSERLSMDSVRAALTAGQDVLLLISLALMRNFAVPHWVRCSGVAGSAVVIDDPSVDPVRGESWVDGHLLPIATAELDAMAAYGPGGYRGAVLLGRS